MSSSGVGAEVRCYLLCPSHFFHALLFLLLPPQLGVWAGVILWEIVTSDVNSVASSPTAQGKGGPALTPSQIRQQFSKLAHILVRDDTVPVSVLRTYLHLFRDCVPSLPSPPLSLLVSAVGVWWVDHFQSCGESPPLVQSSLVLGGLPCLTESQGVREIRGCGRPCSRQLLA